MKRILLLTIIASICFWSCDDKVSNPQITFENGIDSIAEVFPGDLFYVKGKVSSEDHISQVFYFHQKKDENGKIVEEGDKFELDKSGDGSFSLSFIATPTTIGVKIIAQDTKNNRSVKVFKVIQGVDGIDITIEGSGFVEEINSGETFIIKGKVESKTKITSFTYQVAKGDILDNPINIPVTNDLEHPFELPIIARNGMTGIILKAVNKGELTVTKLFELKHVIVVGPIILFDNDMLEVKPDSIFAVTGRISSNDPIEVTTYSILRGAQSDTPKPFELDANKRFNFNVNVGEDVTGVAITAIDTKGNESMQTMIVSILFPSMTEGIVMRHYKNIIFTDAHYPKSYFSFDMAPYILNDAEAKANQDQVNLIYTNVFISSGHNLNGAALFSPNVSTGGTIKANKLVEGWNSPFNVTRLPAINDFYSTLGKTFDEIADNAEEWVNIDAFVKGKMGNSGVLRQSNLSVGYMFGIGFGGKATDRSDMDRFGVAIVRGFGGGQATSEGESTGAWIELEIKIRK